MTEPRDLLVHCSLFLHALEMSVRPSTRHVHNTLVSVCGRRWHQYDALSVRESSAGEPADGAVEKSLVLIELHDVIAWGGVRHHSIPGPIKFTVHWDCLRYERNLLNSPASIQLIQKTAKQRSRTRRNCWEPRGRVMRKGAWMPHRLRVMSIILMNSARFIPPVPVILPTDGPQCNLEVSRALIDLSGRIPHQSIDQYLRLIVSLPRFCCDRITATDSIGHAQQKLVTRRTP
jgi:hypothetical protein